MQSISVLSTYLQQLLHRRAFQIRHANNHPTTFSDSNYITTTPLLVLLHLQIATTILASLRILNRFSRPIYPLVPRTKFHTSIPKMGVHNILSEQEWKDALGKPGVMVVDCFATWCGPCKVIAPKVVE